MRLKGLRDSPLIISRPLHDHSCTLKLKLLADCLIWQLWSELELHLSEELDEDVSFEEFFDKWKNIAKCFLGVEIVQGKKVVCVWAYEVLHTVCNLRRQHGRVVRVRLEIQRSQVQILLPALTLCKYM